MQSGIYLIGNTLDNRVYIGSASNLYKRFYNHSGDLLKKNHPNRYLQNFCNKHGLNTLFFKVLEFCERKREILRIREQHYIDFYKPIAPIGFNICPTAETSFGIKMSQEARKHLSDIRKGVKRGKYSEEHCKALSVALKNSVINQKRLATMQQARAKSYSFVSPKGEIFEGVNVRQFCIKNNLESTKMCAVAKGKRKSHAGWTQK